MASEAAAAGAAGTAEAEALAAAAPAEAPKLPKAVALVVFQHGSHGRASDFDNIRANLESCWAAAGSGLEAVALECWSTAANEGIRTDDGLALCGERVAAALAAELDLVRARHGSARLLLVCIAHSFGGLVLRRALALLAAEGRLEGLDLASLVTLASPHVGARTLNPLLRLGARALGKVFSTAYQDLLLDSEELDQLCTGAALEPLARFRRRCLYACGAGDHLVGFPTGALMVPVSEADVMVPPSAACSVFRSFLLQPLDGAQDGGLQSRMLMQVDARGAASESGVLEVTNAEGIAAAFAGFDDRNGRSERAAKMLRALRGVGPWTLHVVGFQQRLVLHHSAILHHPSRAKNPGGHGADVAQHVAAAVAGHVREALAAVLTS